ncbi:MAG: sigma-70 family RNA polymerase sigma factor [Caldilineae bacterium]|nr:sigma-70 family RNA polymerase sigma factor [Chloroflexota bacterium]MCB9176001.1 sigma-70 family RNA polymerase sigma factor [Caldilineae bacterium]
MRPEGSVQTADRCDDATLVARVIDGDRRAFEVLYERHKTPLFRTALAITRDRSAAEELLQEAFLRAFRHIRRVELRPEASLRPWLHRILINLSYDWSARRRISAGPDGGLVERIAARSASPERQVERRDLERLVAEAIEQLPFKQRIVVILFYLHDMDLIEIAELLDLPPGTVKSRLHYGRARLREQLSSDLRLPFFPELSHAPATF